MSDKKTLGNTGFNPYTAAKVEEVPRLLYSVPEADNAIICKFLPDLRNNKSYVPVVHYPHQVQGQNGMVMTRYHISQESLGNSQDPEKDARIKLFVKRKQLIANKGSKEEIDAINAKLDMCKPKERGWFYFIEPSSDLVKAILLPISIINRLFGAKFQTGKVIPSLMEEMKKKGVSPFDFSSENAESGWVKIYRVGEKMGTEYRVEPVVTSEERTLPDGEKVSLTKFVKFQFGPQVKNLTLSEDDFPNPLAVEAKQALSLRETEEFIQSGYTKLPERFYFRGSSGAVNATARDIPTVEEDESVKNVLDDIEF